MTTVTDKLLEEMTRKIVEMARLWRVLSGFDVAKTSLSTHSKRLSGGGTAAVTSPRMPSSTGGFSTKETDLGERT
jgi:hypothetical protein